MVVDLTMLCFGGTWKTLEFRIRKVVEHRKILAGTWKTIVLRAMWAEEAQLKRFQKEQYLRLG